MRVGEGFVRLYRARAGRAPRNRGTSGRILARGQSYQSFRSGYYFVSGPSQDRLDGDGRIFSAPAARTFLESN